MDIHIQAMKYYSVLKRNRLTYATTKMNFSHINLSEKSQTQNAKYWMILFAWDSKTGETIVVGSRLEVAKRLTAKSWGNFLEDENVLYHHYGDG